MLEDRLMIDDWKNRGFRCRTCDCEMDNRAYPGGPNTLMCVRYFVWHYKKEHPLELDIIRRTEAFDSWDNYYLNEER